MGWFKILWGTSDPQIGGTDKSQWFLKVFSAVGLLSLFFKGGGVN